MDRTFSLRRQEVLCEEPLVKDFLGRWPALFNASQINEEFKRITTVRLESTFMAQLDHCISKLMEIGSDRGGATGQKIRKIRECLLQSKNVEVDARREAAIRALIVYLHEKEEDLFAHFDSTDDYEVGFHRLTMSIAIIGEESSATRTGAIVIEGTQVIMEKNIPRCHSTLAQTLPPEEAPVDRPFWGVDDPSMPLPFDLADIINRVESLLWRM
uniref:Alpha-ketoglutarate-dependent dioxygenase FTO C-terminal domain-containing protein n=1 Tax=Knipowitschia caucasica TaxID=637954 RepID=A0AAV2LSU7_KNICA